MSDVIRTRRLRLRRVDVSDVDSFVALNADEDVMRFLDWQPPAREHVIAEVSGIIEAYQRHPRLGRFVAEDLSGEFIGWFGLEPAPAGPHELELGYRLRRRSWGRGLATEGGRALVDYAFDRTGAQRVYAETMAVNTLSRRVLEKCGMRHVRTFHRAFEHPLPGTELGEVVYEITRGDRQ